VLIVRGACNLLARVAALQGAALMGMPLSGGEVLQAADLSFEYAWNALAESPAAETPWMLG